MKELRITFVAIAFACLVARVNSAGATVINFDDVPIGGGEYPIAADRYKSRGVILSASPGGPLIQYWADYADSPPCVLTGSDASQEIGVEFVVPSTTTPGTTSSVSFYTAGLSSPTWFVTAFDLSGHAVESRSGVGGGSFVSFSHAVPDIHTLVFTSQPHWLGIDTLSFGTISPEPATASLFALAVVALVRRRA